MFLISKFPINEDYLRELIDPAFDERYQIDEQGNTLGLGAHVFDEQNNYENKFKDKYIKDDYQVRRVYYKRYQKKNADEVVKKPDELEVENKDEEEQDQPPEEE